MVLQPKYHQISYYLMLQWPYLHELSIIRDIANMGFGTKYVLL
jgi:hypothetical protein